MDLSLPSLSLFDMDDHGFEFDPSNYAVEEGELLPIDSPIFELPATPPPPPPVAARPLDERCPKPPSKKKLRISLPPGSEKVKRRLFDAKQSEEPVTNQQNSSDDQNSSNDQKTCDEPEEEKNSSNEPKEEKTSDEPKEDRPYVEKRRSDVEKRHSDVEKRHSDVDKRHSDVEKRHSDVDKRRYPDVRKRRHSSVEKRRHPDVEKRRYPVHSNTYSTHSNNYSAHSHHYSVQFKKHVNVVGSLAMRENDGYTVTNGRHSLTDSHLHNVSRDIFDLRIRKLFLVDATSYALWKRYRTTYVENEIATEQQPFTLCSFCDKADCHRYMATVCGLDKIQGFQVQPAVRHDRKHTWHYTPATLCVSPSGFTVSNGRISAHRDGPSPLSYIAEVVESMRVNRLFFVDEYTASKCTDLRLRIPTKTMVWNEEAGRCSYCNSTECHRWRAVVGGIARLLKYPVDPIEH